MLLPPEGYKLRKPGSLRHELTGSGLLTPRRTTFAKIAEKIEVLDKN